MKKELSVVYQELEDGWIMAQVPELPGAVTQGKDLAEAREMIKEAVELLLETYLDRLRARPVRHLSRSAADVIRAERDER